MNRELIQVAQQSAMDVLRLYAALISAPFTISKAFVSRPRGEPFRWPPESRPTPADECDAAPN